MLTSLMAPRHALTLTAVAVSALVISFPGLAAGQSLSRDARWEPWIGCWTPAIAGASAPGDAEERVCVVPVASPDTPSAAGSSAVEIITISGDRVLSRERLDASGERRAHDRDGCSGWERAVWSTDGRRVYLESEATCAGGLKRRTTGLVAMAPNGDWLHIVGVAVRDRVGVRVLRHYASASATLPADVQSSLEPRSRASEAARIAGAVWPIGTAEVVDATQHVSPGVVEAWLAESRQAFTVDAKRLLQLADAGVDGRVIDMLIALSYPRAFAIKPSSSTIGALAVRERGGGSDPDWLGVSSCGPYAMGLSVYGWDGCSMYGSAMYAAGLFGYSRYDGLFGYNGGYFADGAPVVITRPPEQPSTHGQVVNGRGYSSGSSSGDSGGTAGASDSGSSSAGSSGGGSGAVSSGGDRTAVPR